MRHKLCFGVVRVTAGFGCVLCLYAYLCGLHLTLLFLAAAVLHELGHILSAYLMGLSISELELSALGARLTLTPGRETSFGQDLLLCYSGPAVNLLLALCLGWIGKWPLFLAANLLLGIFNLLPVLPLDGGGGLFALLSLLLDDGAARRTLSILSLLTALGVTALGGWVLYLDHAKPFLLGMGLWLLGNVCARR